MTPVIRAMKPVICVDFDGVIHAGHCTELVEPVPGAPEFLAKLVKEFDVAIFSVRNQKVGGIPRMRDWLREHCPDAFEHLDFPTAKPPAHIYLDDRGWQFTGTFPSVDELLAFQPWQIERTN